MHADTIVYLLLYEGVSMYIAIVADNVAQRKQAERLMARANTALSPSIGTLYISSFGDETAFLHACMKFDLFLLDFDGNTAHSLEIAKKLREQGAPGISVICKYEDEPFSYETAIQGVYTLDKPILTAPLHKLIADVAKEVEEKRKQVSLIELRGESGTHYVPKDDIMYVEIYDNDHRLVYHLATDEAIEMMGNFNDVLRALGHYPEFQLKLKHICFNTDYIKEENKKSILLSNGEHFSYPLLHRFLK
ncbi:MAG: hypothetical protein IKR58_00385 [Lachnospiraceae bacterium]|nr:hypothetical protein [Lachnospiraceae bacterium]